MNLPEMTAEKWAQLTEADKQLMRMLGVTAPTKTKVPKVTNPVTKERRLSIRTTSAESYECAVTTTCLCCGIQLVTYGSIVKEGNYSYFVRGEVGLTYKNIKTEASSCVKCTDTLMSLSKEELVACILAYNSVEYLRGK